MNINQLFFRKKENYLYESLSAPNIFLKHPPSNFKNDLNTLVRLWQVNCNTIKILSLKIYQGHTKIALNIQFLDRLLPDLSPAAPKATIRKLNIIIP